MENKQKVLFVCTGNSCRSQIAEGLLRHMANKYVDVFSAGSHPSRVHPNAISVMDEVKIDISNQTSDGIDQYLNAGIDTVITVCDNASKICPVFPGETKRIHWSIEDPFKGWNAEKKHLNSFRSTRDELKIRIQQFIKEME